MNLRNYISKIPLLVALAALGGCNYSNFSLLDPKGPIGADERSLILIALALMMIVVIPVFVMTIYFAWRYRASNERATYAPKWSHSTKIEVVVWMIPALIILTLGIIVWDSTHKLNPYHPLASENKPVTIEAVSMNWKWLFIYPDQHIATINKIVFPVNVPVSFHITSDVAMTSFFIPRLGTQIYAMPGMKTQVHLLANEEGNYTGRNFQFNGAGYAGMKFQAVATSEKNFEDWVSQVKQSEQHLDFAAFQQLEQPSADVPVSYYASVQPKLFDQIISKFVDNHRAEMAHVKAGASHAG